MIEWPAAKVRERPLPVQKPTDPVAVRAPDYKLLHYRPESIGLPARYAIRLEDLQPWHRIEAVCFRCNRTRELTLARLKRGRSPRDRLIDVETKLRCTNWRRGGDHVLNVTVAPRD